MSLSHASPRRLIPLAITLSIAAAWGCGDEARAPVPPTPVTLASLRATVVVTLDPFVIQILDAAGEEVLTSLTGSAGDAYGGPAATIDTPYHVAQSLPGWDGYAANEAPWRRASSARVTASGQG